MLLGQLTSSIFLNICCGFACGCLMGGELITARNAKLSCGKGAEIIGALHLTKARAQIAVLLTYVPQHDQFCEKLKGHLGTA